MSTTLQGLFSTLQNDPFTGFVSVLSGFELVLPVASVLAIEKAQPLKRGCKAHMIRYLLSVQVHSLHSLLLDSYHPHWSCQYSSSSPISSPCAFTAAFTWNSLLPMVLQACSPTSTHILSRSLLKYHLSKKAFPSSLLKQQPSSLSIAQLFLFYFFISF